ncbi:E3 ubiquitin-protein ligase BRE1-like [Teleopsis dalmanni]|uniref:E3 ubiquitin-protein ligase BRE1-like n=1 Tax=Teleopsis dalmanni TaxID=139649 RepID=UPI0018CEEDC7|nr:E3 ubiquitin-protein ligase BRE1-like [Teleopsis dalmanni]
MEQAFSLGMATPAELDVNYQGQVTDLQKQINFYGSRIQDAENYLQMTKQKLLKVQQELNNVEHNSEDEIEIEACQKPNFMSRELEEYRLSTDKLSMEVQLLTDKISAMGKQIETHEEKSILYDSLKLQHEKDLNELDLAKSEIRNLENQIVDLKKLSKNNYSSSNNYSSWNNYWSSNNHWSWNNHSSWNNHWSSYTHSKLEHEVQFLRSVNKDLKYNTQQEIFFLKSRLRMIVEECSEYNEKNVKLKREIAEWMKLAQDNCPTNVRPNPLALHAEIERLLENSKKMVAEKNVKESEMKSINSDLVESKNKCDEYAKNIKELKEHIKELMIGLQAFFKAM